MLEELQKESVISDFLHNQGISAHLYNAQNQK